MTRRWPILFASTLLMIGLAQGCRSLHRDPPDSAWDKNATPPAEFELNFVGLCVEASEWQDAYRFYTQRLGMRPRRQDGHWAVFGAGWDAYVLGRSRGLVCELFEGGGSAPPAIGIGLQVRNLQGAIGKASARGARFEPEVAVPAHPAGAHLAGPKGVRWSLHQTDTARSADDLSEPEITRVDLHVADLQGQIEFYHRILGLPMVTRDGSSPIVLRRHPDGPELVLLSGGRWHVLEPRWKEQPALGQKVFLGFMTQDIHRAASQLKSAGVRILHEVEHHDWGGTDLIVADADGNAVQVFTLDTDHRFGSGRAR